MKTRMFRYISLKFGFVLLFFFGLFSFSKAQNQFQEDNSLKEFNSGQLIKYSSLGLGKSSGLKIHFKYPKSWQPIDGERPHILKKFVQPGGTVLAIIQIVQFDFEPSRSEINYFFSNELPSMYPNVNIVSMDSNLQIEGLRSSVVEFANISVRADENIYSHNLDFTTIYHKYRFSILFMVVDKVGESKEGLQARYMKLRPLFYQMINSIVIDNVWEN